MLPTNRSLEITTVSFDDLLQPSTEGLARLDDAVLGNLGEGLSNVPPQGYHSAAGNSADPRLHVAPEEEAERIQVRVVGPLLFHAPEVAEGLLVKALDDWRL